MLKQLLTISFLFLFLVMFPLLDSFSEESEDVRSRIKGPIIVTSETLLTDNKANTALFEKNVVARTTEITLYADRMLVYYKEEGGDVTRIEASGNVRIHKDSRIITSQNATYFADRDEIILTGEPRAVDGENVVTGTKMTFFLKEDRSYVENSKVFLKNNKD